MKKAVKHSMGRGALIHRGANRALARARRKRHLLCRHVVESLEQRTLLATQQLPDLIPWIDQSRNFVYGWTLDTTTIPGDTLLRLTNDVANVGQGPFEVRGSTVYPDNTQDVLQRVYNSDGTFNDYLAGKFVYHPTHNHTHFEGLAQYNLRSVTPGDGVGGLVAGGLKTSFCLVDTIKYVPAVPGTPASAVYQTCTPTRQGISVGWSDIYDKSLPDQWIDVTNIPTGRYWLEVQVDPDNHVLETNDNNVARIMIDLPGSGANFNQSIAASTLTNPTAMAIAPDGKMFIAEKGGSMEVWQNNVQLQSNFFRDVPIATQTTNERGLLGVAFDPNYASNRFVYVYYTTNAADAHNRVSRFTANATGDLAVGSEQILLDLDPHSSSFHNGGAIHFGTDGKLYIATGDNSNQDNGTATHDSQRLDKLDGKVLRINPDGSIPTDNPFFSTATGKYRSIWSLGLRNPGGFGVQPGTGRIFTNDNGVNTEEIDDTLKGANYGWPSTEGDFNQASFPTFTRPFSTYQHGNTGTPFGTAMTGGTFYNPTTNQFGVDYLGDYFFADYTSSKIYRMDLATKIVTEFATIPVGVDSVVDLTVDPAGNLYYLARNAVSGNGGQVFKITTTSNPAPSITQQPTDKTVAIGESATWTVIASGQNLTYQWQRANAATPNTFVNISGETTPVYTLANPQPSDNGARFRVIVSNGFGPVTSSVATLTVTSNHVPNATIDLPTAGSTYFAGQTINFSGTITDQEDGDVALSGYVWEIRFYHQDDGEDHFHTFNTFPYIKSGSFMIPQTGNAESHVWYRIMLTAIDSAGAQQTVYRDILPQTVTVTLATTPAGLPLTLNSLPAPASFQSVVGMQIDIGAPTSAVLNNNGYVFSNWSDGGAATHTVTTPATNVTYTANYVPGAAPGVKSEFFDETVTSDTLPDLTGRTPDLVRTDSQINFPLTDLGSAWTGLDNRFIETFDSRHTGYVRIDTAGSYTFYLNSNDGSKLWIDGTLLVNNDGRHTMLEQSGTRTLTAGYHSFRLEFFQALNQSGLIMSWAGPGVTKQIVPASNLFLALAAPSTPPTVQTPAAASPNPATGTTTGLSVLGADDGGEANLTYTWATTGSPPAPVSFGTNGTNAAKSTTATFGAAGTYNFQVTIRDAGGQTVTSSVACTVSQTFTSVSVSPATATVANGATQPFTATARDQFNNSMSGVTFIWSIDTGGVGSVNPTTGLYTAPASGTGTAGVRATSGGKSAKGDVTVQSGPAAFQQDSGSDGLLVVEAENFDANVAQSGFSWTPYTATSGFSGTGARQATPNNGAVYDTGAFIAGAPHLDFRVNFVKTGIHYVWVRGLGPTTSDDSVHVAMDGVAQSLADRMDLLPAGAYGWLRATKDGPVAQINVTTTGLHTINIYMREDGSIVDKLLLTTNASYTPTGLGPAQSPRTGGTNQAPNVSAGSNQTITLPASANLSGSANDDGLPTGSTLTTTWSKFSGPGTVTFGNVNALATSAGFSTSGTYVLRLTASDGTLSNTSDVTITVNPQPTGPTVTSMVLVNTDTQQVIMTLSTTSTNTLNRSTLPAHFSIQANTSPATVGSVKFGYDANATQRIENAAPYFFNGDYVPFTFTAGAHTVSATAFSGANASGTAGPTLTVNLNVI